jgi:hypothetical protein
LLSFLLYLLLCFFFLQIIVWLIGGNLTPYFLAAGLDHYLVNFIAVVINVFVNSFIGVPLMQSQFGDWLQQKTIRPTGSSHSSSSSPSCWSPVALVLRSGFPRAWMQMVALIVYVAICVLCGAMA